MNDRALPQSMGSRAFIVAVTGCIVFCSACDPAVRRFRIETENMAPTLQKGQSVKTIPINWGAIQRFEIIAYRPPYDSNSYVFGRVIGLPNEVIQIELQGFRVNGVRFAGTNLPPVLATNYWVDIGQRQTNYTWTLGSMELFIVGDNLLNSNDGRSWGPLPLGNVVGNLVTP
jgi:signal peptidase I